MADGHVVRHAVDAIELGHTYRQDLGDIDALAESIQTFGLLQPIVISSDNLLILGRRRLEAVRRLRWREVDVWVASDLSDRLRTAMAVRDEHTLQKELTPVESAALYAELKELYAEEAARRQAATRFGAPRAETAGAVDSTAPMDARVQAARAITGRDSHGMMEQVLELQRIAGDQAAPSWLREQTEKALADLSADGKVNGRYLAIKTAQARHELEETADDETKPSGAREVAREELNRLAVLPHPQLAAQAAKRATKRVREATIAWAGTAGAEAAALASRFAAGVEKHFGWWDLIDPVAVARHLTDEQWELLTSSWAATQAFMDEAIAARQQRDADAAG